MEERLALRIRLFRETGQVRQDVADFVTGELEALAATGRPVSEESAGMLTSHLMMAFSRLRRGEAIEEYAVGTGGQVSDELAAHPAALAEAREIAVRAEAALGSALPDTEVAYLALHLAVLAERSPAN